MRCLGVYEGWISPGRNDPWVPRPARTRPAPPPSRAPPRPDPPVVCPCFGLGRFSRDKRLSKKLFVVCSPSENIFKKQKVTASCIFENYIIFCILENLSAYVRKRLAQFVPIDCSTTEYDKFVHRHPWSMMEERIKRTFPSECALLAHLRFRIKISRAVHLHPTQRHETIHRILPPNPTNM